MKKIDAHQHFWKFNPQRDKWITEDMAVIQRDFIVLCFKKHSACMGHTMQHGYAFFFFKKIIHRISIRLKITCKIFQYFHWALSSSAFLVIEPDQSIYAVVIYPIITAVGSALFIFI